MGNVLRISTLEPREHDGSRLFGNLGGSSARDDGGRRNHAGDGGGSGHAGRDHNGL